jgi:hypothetical protein
MNEPTHLENHLRFWTLRRPSAKIHAKLFAVEAQPAPVKYPIFSWNWLAPSAICIFTMLVMLGARPHSSARFGEADTNLFFASITMNNVTSFTSSSSLKSAFNLSKMDLNLEQNVWRTASFESTNRAQSPSSKRSVPMDTTNSLTR